MSIDPPPPLPEKPTLKVLNLHHHHSARPTPGFQPAKHRVRNRQRTLQKLAKPEKLLRRCAGLCAGGSSDTLDTGAGEGVRTAHAFAGAARN